MNKNFDELVELLVILFLITFLIVALVLPRLTAPRECWTAQDPTLCSVILKNY